MLDAGRGQSWSQEVSWRTPRPPGPCPHPASDTLRAAGTRTGQGCTFLAPPTSEQSKENHETTSEPRLKSQCPGSPTLTVFKAHRGFQVLQRWENLSYH